MKAAKDKLDAGKEDLQASCYGPNPSDPKVYRDAVDKLIADYSQ